MTTPTVGVFPESLIPVADTAGLHHLAHEERVDRFLENIDRGKACNLVATASHGRRVQIVRELRDEQYLIFHIAIGNVHGGHLQTPEGHAPIPDHDFMAMKIPLMPVVSEPVDAITHEVHIIDFIRQCSEVPVPFVVKAGSEVLLEGSDQPIPYIVLSHGKGRPLTIERLQSKESHEVRELITQLVDILKKVINLHGADVRELFKLTSESNHVPFRKLSERPDVCAAIFRHRQISQALGSLSEPVACEGKWGFYKYYNDVIDADFMRQYMTEFPLSDDELGVCLPKLDMHNIFVNDSNEITAVSGWDAAFCGPRELMVPPRWLFDGRGPEEWRNMLRQAVLDVSHEPAGGDLFESWYLEGPENYFDEIDDDAATYRFAVADALRRPHQGIVWPKWEQHPWVRVTGGQPAEPIRAAREIAIKLSVFLKEHGLLQVVMRRQSRRIAAAKACAIPRPANPDAPEVPSGEHF